MTQIAGVNCYVQRLGASAHGCRLLFEAESDTGLTGYGEAVAQQGSGEPTFDELCATALRFARSLTGCGVPPKLTELTDRFERWVGAHELPSPLRFGAESAVLSLLAAEKGVPLHRLLGGHETALRLCARLAGRPAAVLDAAAVARVRGYGAALLEVGGRPPREAVRLTRAVRRCIGPGMKLRIGVDRRWDMQAALDYARDARRYEIDFVAEPMDDMSRFVNFAAESGLCVALDKTVAQFGYEALERWRGVRVAVLRPMVLGGIEVTMWLARRASNMNMRPIIGASGEGPVGTAALAALAAYTMAPEDPVAFDSFPGGHHPHSQALAAGRAGEIDPAAAFKRSQQGALDGYAPVWA